MFVVAKRLGLDHGWTKIPLGMEFGLGPGEFVLDGNPAPIRELTRIHQEMR